MSSMRFHPTGRGYEDDKNGQEGCSTTANASSYWIDRRLTGLAGPDYDATISFGLPFEPEDSQYGECRLIPLPEGRPPFCINYGTFASNLSFGAKPSAGKGR